MRLKWLSIPLAFSCLKKIKAGKIDQKPEKTWNPQKNGKIRIFSFLSQISWVSENKYYKNTGIIWKKTQAKPHTPHRPCETSNEKWVFLTC